MNDGASRTNQSEGAVFAFLREGFDLLPLSPDRAQLDQLSALVGLLSSWGARINLTGHRDPLEMAGRLILDAAALAVSVPEIREASTLSDLGTGAGFPGLPLAILHPTLHVLLVDSRKKRNHFQREVRRRLALENADPILGRVEQIQPTISDVVVAQAIAEPDRALELMAPWAGPAGTLVLPASEHARPPTSPPGWRDPERRGYTVPLVGTERRIWVIRRR